MAEAVDRSMVAEFRQGSIDNTYIQLAPGVGGLVETGWRVDRAINEMPYQYINAELHGQDPFAFARAHRLGQSVERFSAYAQRRDPVSRELRR
jgi:hypothetical protein